MADGSKVQFENGVSGLVPRHFPAPDELVYLNTPGACREEHIDGTFSVFRDPDDRSKIVGFRIRGFTAIVIRELNHPV
ncbi:MAG: hypothetical protein ABA06_03170 [Parcubacteria bacterium C7867-001]|nr:MAG: hypothetical protein ABA06_03170 [Parcubacteria bacterium C7867-001]